jgi:antitoxin component YwqK of YwqJK toxin-antitoxin module
MEYKQCVFNLLRVMHSGKSNQLMRKSIICLLTIISIATYGQGTEERVLYVVDSIPIIDDPEEGEGTLTETDIETLTVVTSKADIEKHGYKDLDKIIFVITKEYAKRPEELRKIPTVKLMQRKNGKWCLKDSQKPYTGPFIDYYYNGRKQGEGILKDGLLEGLRTVYYQNGMTSYYRNFVNGIENGESKEYFQNGKIHLEGAFKNGKDEGLWKEWYSTGQLKRETAFKSGEAIPTKEQEKFHKLLLNGIKMFREENYQGAVRTLDKAIELNPNYSDAYFHRGTAYFHDFKFDEAIKDYDKAIELEPLYMESLSNRAFARLRKYEFKNSRTLSKNQYVTVLATKDKVEIPKDEQEQICADLNKGYQLGDTKPMIVDAMKNYCR